MMGTSGAAFPSSPLLLGCTYCWGGALGWGMCYTSLGRGGWFAWRFFYYFYFLMTPATVPDSRLSTFLSCASQGHPGASKDRIRLSLRGRSCRRGEAGALGGERQGDEAQLPRLRCSC